MGYVFKKTVTRPIPPGAEIIVRAGGRCARWKDARGKLRTAQIKAGEGGVERIRSESSTYFARYRDGNGIVVQVPTECRDKTAAQAVLAELERKAERVRAGLLTPAEARTAEHQATPIEHHVVAYVDSMVGRGIVPMHRQNTKRHLERLVDECGFTRLGDLSREPFEQWLTRETAKKEPRSARSRNAHHTALVAFCNWCVSTGRLVANPFMRVQKANEAADPRRRRRAMTEAELTRLLDVARQRPLVEALKVRRGRRQGELVANIRPEVRVRLEAVGRERALIYKTLVLTGLRMGELASLTIAHLSLDAPVAHVELNAADEKNREGNGVVLRADLANDLRQWLADKLSAEQAKARTHGEPIPVALPAATPVFNVPTGLLRIFDRDLVAAGIPKRDERGRTLDLHALRTTFGTLLSKGGVPLRTAQTAMRHSDPSLTANVYVDPKLLDVHGALDVLPSLPLDGGFDTVSEYARATGTDTYAHRAVALPVALTPDKAGQTECTAVKTNSPDHTSAGADQSDASVFADNGLTSLTTPVSPSHQIGATRRLLNFLSLASGVGKPGCGDRLAFASPHQSESCGEIPSS